MEPIEQLIASIISDKTAIDSISTIMALAPTAGEYCGSTEFQKLVLESKGDVHDYVHLTLHDSYGYASVVDSNQRNVYIVAIRGLLAKYKSAKIPALLPAGLLGKLLPKRAILKERKVRHEQKFVASCKALTLDMFAYSLFASHINGSKKKLTGADALRYMRTLPKHSANEELIIYYKYMTLLWQNAVQTQGLSDYILGLRHNNVSQDIRPFAIINSITQMEAPYNTQVHFTNSFFRARANEMGISLITDKASINDSELHSYITGIPKLGLMSDVDIAYALDKILILSQFVSDNTLECPYYQMALDQVLEELSRPGNLVRVNILNTKHLVKAATFQYKTLLKLKKDNINE